MSLPTPNQRRRAGQALVEFTFVGIPMIFVLISVFEVSRGMWNYHTLAYASKSGVRFAIVHGQNCLVPPQVSIPCTRTVGQIAQVIKDAGVGLDLNDTTVTLASVDLAGGVVGTPVFCSSLLVCLSNGTLWPPNDGSNQKGRLVSITVKTVFRSAIAMLWPGSAPISFAATNLAASSSDRIQF
jgi:hypothetical protein